MTIGDIELQTIKNMLIEIEKEIINDDNDYNRGLRDGFENVVCMLESRQFNELPE